MGEPAEPDEDGWTEAYDGEVDRNDMVGKAANGTPWLFMKSTENAAAGGMFSADAVAELLAKASAEDLAKAAYEALVKEKYNTDDRKRMAANGQALDDGSYPIADAEDVHNAVHAVGRGGASHDAIRRHIIRRAKALGESAQIPDHWAADGSLKQAVSKAGDASVPGSPAWEAQDAAQAQQAITQLGSLRALVQQLAQREGQEVGAGHMDDLDDVFDLQGVDDALCYALKTLAGFAAMEQAESVTKATPNPADAVHDAITKLAGACGCPVCTGWIAGAKQQGAHPEASQPPADANDGPAADQQAPQPAPPKPTPAAQPAVATPEQTMTKTADTESTAATTAAGTDDQAAALAKAQHKAEKKARRAAVEAALLKATEHTTALETELAQLRKRVESVESQPAQGSGPMFNGATPGATPLAPAIDGRHATSAQDDRASLLKAIAEESDPVRKAELMERNAIAGFKEVFSKPPTVAPAPRPQS